MKAVISAVLIGLFAWVFVIARNAMLRTGANTVQAAAIAVTNTQYATPTFRPTETPVPTSTIGYEATIYVAQATADEARRVNAEVTAAHEVYLLAQMQLTADVDYRIHEQAVWTAIGGQTSIPLTATAQVIDNTKVADANALASGQLTATYQAPMQISAMANAQASVIYAEAARIADLVGKWTLIGFVIVLSVFLWRRAKMPNLMPVVEDEPQTETIIHMRKPTGTGTFEQKRLIIPCSPEQLTELAEMAVNGEKKFGINRLETQSRTFRGQRAVLIAVRRFLLDSGLVIPDGNGTITLNADGEAFLVGWFDTHQLSDEYEFDETASPPPSQHDHDTHAHDEKHDDFGGGGGQDAPEGEEEYAQEGAI